LKAELFNKMSRKLVISSLSEQQLQKLSQDLQVSQQASKYAFNSRPNIICLYEAEGDDLYIPFAYGKKFSRPPRENFSEQSVEFIGQLRDNQKEVKKEAIERLNSCGSVIIAAACGFGKTSTAIYIATKIRLKTLILCHRVVLVNQWRDSIKKFCPEATVQVLSGSSRLEDVNFYIMNAINVSKHSRSFYKDMGMVITDECIPGKTPILLENGVKNIEDIHNEFEKGKSFIVQSYNEKTKIFEPKKVLYTWKRPIEGKKLMKLTFFGKRRNISCTDNHKILTSTGYKYAKDISIGDLIVSYSNHNSYGDISNVPNSDQWQIILGSFLGDGCVSELPCSGRYRLRIIHGEAQYEYCKWKAYIMGINTLEYVPENGYSKKPAYRFCTKMFDTEKLFPSKKGDCPQWIIDEIDLRGIAIWYMDDGSIGKNGNCIRFHTESFTIESVQRLVEKLKKYEVLSRVVIEKKKYPVIYIDNVNTKKLLSLISPYLHESMHGKIITKEYKIWMEDFVRPKNEIYNKLEYVPVEKLTDKDIIISKNRLYPCKWLFCNICNCYRFHGTRNDSKTYRCYHNNPSSRNIQFIYNPYKYTWSNIYENYGYLRVKKAENCGFGKEKFVYDLEVEDNHNFILASIAGRNGPVVHNCHLIMADKLSQCMRYLTPRYMLGLSATPYRTDGLDILIDMYFGKHKIVRKLFRKHTVYRYNTGFKPEVKINKMGKVDWSSVLESQCGNTERNETIVKLVKFFPERTFLILCKRVEQAKYIEQRLTEEKEDVTSLIGSKQEFEQASRILVGTVQKTGVGFDHPRLNTLILASDVEQYFVQYLGRVFRREDTEPVIIDLVDNYSLLYKHFQTRNSVYIEHGGIVKDFHKEFPNFLGDYCRRTIP